MEELLSEIEKIADHQIPGYAFCDNQAGVELADRLDRIVQIIRENGHTTNPMPEICSNDICDYCRGPVDRCHITCDSSNHNGFMGSSVSRKLSA